MMKLTGSVDASKCADHVESLPDTTTQDPSFTIPTEQMVSTQHDVSNIVSEA